MSKDGTSLDRRDSLRASLVKEPAKAALFVVLLFVAFVLGVACSPYFVTETPAADVGFWSRLWGTVSQVGGVMWRYIWLVINVVVSVVLLNVLTREHGIFRPKIDQAKPGAELGWIAITIACWGLWVVVGTQTSLKKEITEQLARIAPDAVAPSEQPAPLATAPSLPESPVTASAVAGQRDRKTGLCYGAWARSNDPSRPASKEDWDRLIEELAQSNSPTPNGVEAEQERLLATIGVTVTDEGDLEYLNNDVKVACEKALEDFGLLQ
ncbi:MAG: hypothetical protein KDD69_06365 [Bdellovibrionales bacterium]|nr:hypothetical protein [Bdellovibrionales bacterium]